LAKKLGATHCVNPKDEKYNGKKIQDIIIEMVKLNTKKRLTEE
jgi:Zn-dependent alcohol dehydrogenase